MSLRKFGSLFVAALGLLLMGCQQGGQNVAPIVYQESIGSSSALATIDGKEFTESDLAKGLTGRSKGNYIKAKSEFFNVQKQALDDFIFEKLLQMKAQKEGISRDDYYKREVEGKLKKVTEADMKKFYDDFSKQAKGMGRGLPPFDKVKPQIEQKLKEDRMVERKENLIAQLRKEFKVDYLLSPPRLNVEVGDNQMLGSAKAPVTIVEFSDFECPFCKRGADTLKEVAKKYKGKVKVYFRDFPLGFHKRAKLAANAARCAGEQGKYWEMHDMLFEKQRQPGEWTHKEPKASEEETDKKAMDVILGYGKKLGLKGEFEKCVKEQKYYAQIDKDFQAGSEMGVTGTPAFFVNGIPMPAGARPAEEFEALINQELERAKMLASKKSLP